MRLSVEYVDPDRGDIIVDTIARDVVEMERRFKMRVTERTPSYEETLFLGYKALRREGKVEDGVKFDDWLNTVRELSNVDDGDNGEGADPTED